MKKSEFLQAVQAELDNIKAKATKKEIKKLDFSKLLYFDRENCIYGLMTGECQSERARELQPKHYSAGFCRGESFSKQIITKGNQFTPLEIYLYIVANKYEDRSKKHKEIIQYLKGEIKTIEL